jgi:hypothetical protein
MKSLADSRYACLAHDRILGTHPAAATDPCDQLAA